MSISTPTPEAPTQEATEAFAQQIIGYFTGQSVTLMIHIGDRLGLYSTLREQGAMSVAQLASKSGLQPRWLLEWLRNQAAAGILEHHGKEHFVLSSAGSAVLADPSSPFYLAGFFHSMVPTSTLDRIADAFSSGKGMSYEEHGQNCACTMKRMFAPGHCIVALFSRSGGWACGASAIGHSGVGCGLWRGRGTD